MKTNQTKTYVGRYKVEESDIRGNILAPVKRKVVRHEFEAPDYIAAKEIAKDHRRNIPAGPYSTITLEGIEFPFEALFEVKNSEFKGGAWIDRINNIVRYKFSAQDESKAEEIAEEYGKTLIGPIPINSSVRLCSLVSS